MPDLDKLYEKADKYLQRQKFEAAIETYEEILRYEPNDEEALITLGDLCAKMSRTAEALRYQLQLADLYNRRSDSSKAIATYRKVLKLSPQDVVTLMKLAGLLEKSQKNTEALEAYREALGYYRRAGLNAQMLDCLTRIVKLEPTSLEDLLEFAELASRTRQSKVAMPALLRAAQLARRAGDENRWEKLVDQAHALDPADEVASTAAAELALKRGNFDEVTKLVTPMLAKKPEDLELIQLACKGFLGAGNYTRAHPLCLKLYHANPERVDLVLQLMEGLVQTGAVQQVLAMANQLKDPLFQQGKRNEVLKIIEKGYESDESNLEVLEVLSNLYNEMNQEEGLRRSLSRLFNLYLASENYRKAGDTLERILDVDPYGEGHQDRLVNLEGHIDSIWYNNILSRMEPASSGRTSPTLSAAVAATEKAIIGRSPRRGGDGASKTNWPQNWQGRWRNLPSFPWCGRKKPKGFATSTMLRDTRPSSKRPPPLRQSPGRCHFPRRRLPTS